MGINLARDGRFIKHHLPAVLRLTPPGRQPATMCMRCTFVLSRGAGSGHLRCRGRRF